MGWPPSGTMHGSHGSNGSTGANGIRWRPMKMEMTEMDIGNHRAPSPPSARITLRFFCPMVASVNPVGIRWIRDWSGDDFKLEIPVRGAEDPLLMANG